MHGTNDPYGVRRTASVNLWATVSSTHLFLRHDDRDPLRVELRAARAPHHLHSREPRTKRRMTYSYNDDEIARAPPSVAGAEGPNLKTVVVVVVMMRQLALHHPQEAQRN